MIIFPMAGLSRRFTMAGYQLPKYMLEAHEKSLFRHSVEGFSAYFNQIPFLFIARDIADTKSFVIQECKEMGLQNYKIVFLDAPTRGQAETVMLGVNKAELHVDTPLTIFNIDTFRPNFSFPNEFDINQIDGYLEVFIGSGSNWSYVRPESPNSNKVIETAEKREISQFCCTGLYHFSKFQIFQDAYDKYISFSQEHWDANELYVAPLYNLAIRNDQDIRYHVINRNQVIFCGVPSEYEAYKK
jgi:hypothetical protein